MYKHLIRPILFALSQDDAEKAHELTVRLAERIQRHEWLLNLIEMAYANRQPAKPITIAGVKFPNRIGLAAGLDKQAQMLPFMKAIGFGFVEIGSVLPRPQKGNLRPRLFRLPEHNALRNQMGFNSDGAGTVADRLQYQQVRIPIGGSVGKNKETELDDAANDYIRAMQILYPFVDYFTINVSSPNTPGLRRLQGPEYLKDLVRRFVAAVRQKDYGNYSSFSNDETPTFVKFAPDLTDAELEASLDAVISGGGSGVIVGNTTLQPPMGFDSHKYAHTGGGFSGPYLRKRMLEMVAFVRARTGLPIVACGGIWKPDDVKAARDKGADLVQILTALVYEGPGVVRKLSAVR